MAYVLSKKPTFKTKVIVVEPGNADDGAPESSEFIAEFKRLKRDEVEALIKANRPVYEVLAELLVGWSGLKAEDGGDLPFSEDHRAALLQIPHAVWSLWQKFLEESSGVVRKN